MVDTPIMSKQYTLASEDIQFLNKTENIRLSGSYTTPLGLKDFPVAILISGSGPQNRDSEIFGHTPFASLAEHLTKHGIGVLRYDDRGVARSEGKHTTATSYDFSTDVMSAVQFLQQEKNIKKVGLIGHSEGGMIAQIVAVNDPSIAFIVSLAGPGISIKELMLLQNKIALGGMDFSEQEITEYLDFSSNAYNIIDIETPKEDLYDPMKNLVHTFYDTLPDSTQQKIAPSKESLYFQLAFSYFTPWFRYFINYEPGENLEKISCPFLALNGSLDVQVTADENLEAIQRHLTQGPASKIKVEKLDSLNHLFQKAVTGNVDEYKTIEEDFNIQPLEIMTNWILSLE